MNLTVCPGHLFDVFVRPLPLFETPPASPAAGPRAQ